jgi:hypothetical protein
MSYSNVGSLANPNCPAPSSSHPAVLQVIEASLVPLGPRYNFLTWHAAQQRLRLKGIIWGKGDEGYQVGRMKSGQSVELYGPLAGPAWLEIRNAGKPVSITGWLACNGFGLEPLTAPPKSHAYMVHKTGFRIPT